MDDKIRYAAAQTLTGLPIATLYSMVSRKQIPHIRLGPRLVVFSRGELERWLADHRVTCDPRPRPTRRSR